MIVVQIIVVCGLKLFVVDRDILVVDLKSFQGLVERSVFDSKMCLFKCQSNVILDRRLSLEISVKNFVVNYEK